jgi:hypothetical protein
MWAMFDFGAFIKSEFNNKKMNDTSYNNKALTSPAKA